VGNPALGDVYNVDIVEISERFKRPRLECESVLRKYEADWGYGMSLGRAYKSVAPPCENRISEATRDFADHYHGTAVPPPVSKDELAEALQYDHISNFQKARELLVGKLPTTPPVELSYTASPVIKRSYETPRPAVAPLAKSAVTSPGLRSPTVGGGGGRRVTISDNPVAPTPRGPGTSAAAVSEALAAARTPAARTPAVRGGTPTAAVGGGARERTPAATPAAVGGGARERTPAATPAAVREGTPAAAVGGGAEEPAAPVTPSNREVKNTISKAKSELKTENPEVFAKLASLSKAQATPLTTKLGNWVRSNWAVMGAAELMSRLKSILIEPTALEENEVRRVDAGNLLKEAVAEAKRREAEKAAYAKQRKAATKIQALAKGVYVRKTAERKAAAAERKKTNAATTIQAAVRGLKARKEIRAKAASERRAKEIEAATILQAAVRERKARVATAKIKAEASARAPPQPPTSAAAVEGLEGLSWTALHERWKEATGKKAKNKTKAEMIAEIKAQAAPQVVKVKRVSVGPRKARAIGGGQ
jgi:hypothetical protein